MVMLRTIQLLGVICLSLFSQATWALDSYRFMHVTIETPWYIFLFLLTIFFIPFVLMAILVWRFAEKRKTSGVAAKQEGGE